MQQIRERYLEQAQAGLAVLESHRLMRPMKDFREFGPERVHETGDHHLTVHRRLWGSEMPKTPWLNWLKRKLRLRDGGRKAGKFGRRKFRGSGGSGLAADHT